MNSVGTYFFLLRFAQLNLSDQVGGFILEVGFLSLWHWIEQCRTKFVSFLYFFILFATCGPVHTSMWEDQAIVQSISEHIFFRRMLFEAYLIWIRLY